MQEDETLVNPDVEEVIEINEESGEGVSTPDEEKISTYQSVMGNIKKNKGKLKRNLFSFIVVIGVGIVAFQQIFSESADNDKSLVSIPEIGRGVVGNFTDNTLDGSDELVDSILKKEKEDVKKAKASSGAKVFLSEIVNVADDGDEKDTTLDEEFDSKKAQPTITKKEEIVVKETQEELVLNPFSGKQSLEALKQVIDNKNNPKEALNSLNKENSKEALKLVKNAQKELVAISKFLKKKDAGGYTSYTVTNNEDSNKDKTEEADNPQKNKSGEENETETLIATGDVLSIRLLFNLNTDSPNKDVLAELVNTDNQKLERAILKGSIEHEQNFDKIVIKFNTIELKNNKKVKQYAFSAIAIDLETDFAGVADDVDNHYFDRYVLPILLDSAELAADIFINQSIIKTTTKNSDNEDVTVETSNGSDKEIIGGALKGGLQALKGIYSKKTNRKVTVKKDKSFLLKLVALSPLDVEK